MEQTKSKKSIILIIVFILILVGVFFYFNLGGSILNNEFSPKSIKRVIDEQIVLDISKVDSEIKFAPNTGLLQEEVVDLDENFKSQILARVSEYEQKAMSLFPDASMSDFVGTYFTLAADYKTLGQYAKSKDSIEKILEKDPKNSNIIQFYSFLLASMGREDLAIFYINKAISILPNEVSYWLWKINLEKERNADKEKLDALYKLAISSSSQNANIYVLYAQFLTENDRKEEAILNWEEARKLDSQNSEAYQAEINKLK